MLEGPFECNDFLLLFRLNTIILGIRCIKYYLKNQLIFGKELLLIQSNVAISTETSDDHSLDRVPRIERTQSWLSITNITFGIATAIFYFQMGSVMALKFGAINAMISSAYAIIVAGILGTVIAYLSAKSGMNVNLLSRGGGFGYLGASLTSIIYASNFIMYCALEGLILVSAVNYLFPSFPKWALIILFGSIVIPLNWFGIKQLDMLQKWSMPLFLIFLVTAVVVSFYKVPIYQGSVFNYMPEGVTVGGEALLFCIAMHHGIMGLTSLLASDYARYLKPSEIKFGSVMIGFIPQIFCFGIMGGLGIWFGVRFLESDPGVYIVLLLGIGGVIFTLITQLRINVTNIYSSSLSLANFFENIFKFTPGRRFWVVTSGVAAIVLMLLNIVEYVDKLMTFQGVFLLSWAAVLVTDALVVKKALNIGPTYYVARQQFLYKWNPVGTLSLIIASGLGTIAALGYMGQFLESTAAFFAAILASILTISIALITKGKYYLKEEPTDIVLEDKLTSK